MKGTIFVAGTYGVGKSTVCNHLSSALALPSFSAGDLISKVVGEKYGPNKVVKDKQLNQNVLSEQVKLLLQQYASIILAGHFSIFNKNNEVDILPEFVYENLQIRSILLLETNVNRISTNLLERDGRNYSTEQLEKLKTVEYKQAHKIAKKLDIPLLLYHMKFDEQDVERVYALFRKRGVI